MASTKSAEDTYIWLEDLASQKTISWALRQDRLFRAKLRHKLPKLTKEISKFYKAPYILQVKVTTSGAFYLERRNKDYVIRLEKREIINSRNLGKDFVIYYFFADKTGKRLAYFVSTGEDTGFMRVIEVESGARICELKGDIGDLVFTSEGFYYVKNFKEGPTPDGIRAPASRIMKEDRMVYGEGLPSGEFLQLAESNGQAMVTVSQWSHTKIYSGRIDEPSSWKKVRGGNYVSYPVEYVSGKGLLSLSYDHGGNGRIISNNKSLIPEDRDILVGATVVGNEIICNYLSDCSSRLKVFDLDGNLTGKFTPSFKCSIDLMSSNEERAVVVANSYAVPYVVVEYRNGNFRTLDKREELRIKLSEAYAISKDGTKVHYFQLGKETKKVLIFGYGGYSISITPEYDPLYCALVKRGVTVVDANLRGGREYGEKWHNDGKREKKQNVFDDYTSVIRKFKEKGARVVAFGRSNGGLLVGTTMTQHPELLDGALIGYPVLDMMRFHKLLVGKLWTDEYGDPDKKRDRAYLIKYSPYHNLRKTRYPPTMIYTSLHDDRVHPAHAFKYAAKLIDIGSEVWLRVQSKGGHAGANTKTKIDELADQAGFVLYALKN